MPLTRRDTNKQTARPGWVVEARHRYNLICYNIIVTETNVLAHCVRIKLSAIRKYVYCISERHLYKYVKYVLPT